MGEQHGRGCMNAAEPSTTDGRRGDRGRRRDAHERLSAGVAGDPRFDGAHADRGADQRQRTNGGAGDHHDPHDDTPSGLRGVVLHQENDGGRGVELAHRDTRVDGERRGADARVCGVDHGYDGGESERGDSNSGRREYGHHDRHRVYLEHASDNGVSLPRRGEEAGVMTTRVLPPEEWHRLVGTEVESIVPGLVPEHTQVLVVEQDGAIVGTWAVLRLVHVECLWIAPAHRRKAGVAARLLRAMVQAAERWRTPSVWTGSMSPEVTSMIQRLGGIPIPGEHFAIPIGA